MQFLVIAYDFTDDAALSRRMAVRDAHMALVEKHKASGHTRYGAAILDDTGKMIGSMMVVEYPDRQGVDNWLAEEPYVTGKVWDKITISPCRVAPHFT